MKKLTYIILSCSMLLSLNSCEWFNTAILGKPSKAEIARRIKVENARKDSIARAEQARLAEIARQQQEEAEQAEALKNQRYHVIFGCFKVSSNAERMVARLASDGHTPVVLNFANGFSCVSIQSFSDIHTAFNAMNSFMRTVSYCPEDVWVYDSNFGLHR
jgi:cell division protein FtsN